MASGGGLGWRGGGRGPAMLKAPIVAVTGVEEKRKAFNFSKVE